MANHHAPTAYTIIEQIKNHVTCYWHAETVDTFKAGDPAQPVTGRRPVPALMMRLKRSGAHS